MFRALVLALVASLLVLTQSQTELVCNDTNCKKEAGCFCRTQENPFATFKNIKVADLPQFVMLTFDDAVNEINKKFYDELFSARRKNPNNCPITGTFFISHEYNNYQLTQDLYKKGHEIASHSITHAFNTDAWRKKMKSEWKAEMDGMRDMLNLYGRIPKEAIKGIRIPFLQSNGDETFKMLHEEKFLYDSSMVTRAYTHPPMWPFTLDQGFDQDCVIEPCPKGKYPGLWEVPLVSLWRDRQLHPDLDPEPSPCGMADACLPALETEDDMKQYLKENFERHFEGGSDFVANRAPFPVFLHEAWLQEPPRRNGYLKFVDELLKNKDVYFVTLQEVIAFMKSPVNKTEYAKLKTSGCNVPPAPPCSKSRCVYGPKGEFLSERIMYSCIRCTPNYPWLGRVTG